MAISNLERFFLNRKESLLLIVDIQERLAAVMKDREKVVTNVTHLIEATKLLQIPILITEQYPRGLGPTVNEITDSLKEQYRAVEKITFSCCGDEKFTDELDRTGKKQIVITGMETHVCVLQTCLDLLRKGYSVHIVRDAVCSRKVDDFLTGLELMRDAGAIITCTETVLFEWLERAGTEEFKLISKRIK